MIFFSRELKCSGRALVFFLSCCVSLVFCGSPDSQKVIKGDPECSECAQLCNINIPKYFEQAHETVIRAWTELDLLRSIRIHPDDRVHFAHEIFDNLMAILTEITRLKSTSVYCIEQCCRQNKDILDLEEMLIHVADAFKTVFDPRQSGAEKTLQTVLLKTAQEMESFKNILAVKNQLRVQNQK